MSSQEPKVSSWAYEGVYFAGVMLVIIGFFHAIIALSAIIDDEFFVLTENYVFDLDTSAWGWVHLLVSIGLLVTGFALFRRATWAAVVAVVLAVLSAIANFAFIPYYPFWSIVVIALDIWIIWALTRPGVLRT